MEDITAATITAIASLIAVAITAITSIIAALIQTKQARRGREFLPKLPKPAPYPNRTWWRVCGIVLGSSLIWLIVCPDEAPFVAHWGAIPWSTCLLGYFRPIRWGYVAAFVTLLHGITAILYESLTGFYSEADIPILALIFIVNAVLAAGIAFLKHPDVSMAQNKP